jgi:glycosyltransferase involved in cell wall biosynthesis
VLSGITVTNSIHSLLASKLLHASLVVIAQTTSDYSTTPAFAYAKWKRYGWSGIGAAIKAIGDWISSRAVAGAKVMICVSTPVASSLLDKGFSPKKIRISGNGVVLPNLSLDYTKKEFEAAFLGRIVWEKGIKDLLMAWLTVVTTIESARLCVIGSGDYLRDSMEFVREHRLTKNVVFTGFVSELEKYELLSKAKLFVFPSKSDEGWGMTIAEALSCGLPVIAFPDPVVLDVFGANACVVLLPDRRIDTLAKSITNLLGDDNKLEKLGHEARSSASRYSWDKIASLELEILKETVTVNDLD